MDGSGCFEAISWSSLRSKAKSEFLCHGVMDDGMLGKDGVGANTYINVLVYAMHTNVNACVCHNAVAILFSRVKLDYRFLSSPILRLSISHEYYHINRECKISWHLL